MSNQQNDLSLLRPFNLEAAKNGEEICWSNISDEVEFIGVTSTGTLAYESCGELGFTSEHSFCMKPLCWVQGMPVYKGDVLWHKIGKFLTITGKSASGMDDLETDFAGVCIGNLTWNKPKQKVKCKVWINVYPDVREYLGAYYSKEEADGMSAAGRIACVETEIEYEV